MPVVRVLLCLSSKRDTYTKSILAELLILCYQRDKKTPSWQLFVNNFSLYNEEVCEMSYSCLSRMTTQDSKKGDIDHVSMLYSLVNEYAAVDDAIWGDTGRASMRNGSVKFDPDSTTAGRCCTFMYEMIDKLKYGNYQVYPVVKQVKGRRCHDMWRSKAQAAPSLVNCTEISFPSFWKIQLSLDVEFHLGTVRKHMFGSFGHTVREVWPEMVLLQGTPMIEESDDEGQVDEQMLIEDRCNENLGMRALEERPPPLEDWNDVDNGSTERLEQAWLESDDSDQDEFILERRLDAAIGTNRTRVHKLKVGTKVWTIDFVDARSSDELTIYQGIVLPRTVVGRNRRGVATPSGFHRVSFSENGMENIEDIVATNLDKSEADAKERLRRIRGEPVMQQNHDQVQFEVERLLRVQRNEAELQRIFQN